MVHWCLDSLLTLTVTGVYCEQKNAQMLISSKQLFVGSACFILDMINSVSPVHMPHSLSVQTSGPVSLVHMQHSVSVQTSGPVSLVHMQHSLSVQSSGSAVYPPLHTLQLLAAALVCLVLA